MKQYGGTVGHFWNFNEIFHLDKYICVCKYKA